MGTVAASTARCALSASAGAKSPRPPGHVAQIAASRSAMTGLLQQIFTDLVLGYRRRHLPWGHHRCRGRTAAGR
ncbi:hypothetical protein YT1_0229 [Rhodococcus ruber]|nr:hypothetical protein YT1_0229 [Rhodococcus ruber]